MILLDACVPRRYLHLLQEWGYAAELSSSHIAQDATDREVIALASQLDAALLTIDLDFANILTYPPQDYAGLIVLRYAIQDEALVDATLKKLLDELYRDGLRAVLAIVSADRYRIRA